MILMILILITMILIFMMCAVRLPVVGSNPDETSIRTLIPDNILSMQTL